MPSSDSDPVEVTLTPLRGLWVHDPTDAEGTVVQFLYGRANKSTNIEPLQAGTRYAGRTYPVFDFAEFEDLTWGIGVDVPFGDDHAQQLADLEAFVRAKTTLCVRDGRGRRLFATLSGYSERDETWGATVTLTATQVDYDESVL